MAALELTRAQILSFRRSVGALDERLPFTPASLRRAAWAGLQDSMPRAALLSLHSRVKGIGPTAWEHPSLAQIWGPRFSAYVVPARDAAIFTLGRMPDEERDRLRYQDIAERLHGFLKGRRIRFGDVARPLRFPHPNYVRYATATGRLRIRWEGAKQPEVWTVPAPAIDFRAARFELARRYLHVFGTGTPTSFATWAGVRPRSATAAFEGLTRSLMHVRTPVGDAWTLASDEEAIRAEPRPTAATRLLPSGDTYFLLDGAERALLVPEARRRSELWTPRVWPGAVLVDGKIVGIWRRDAANVTVTPWRRLARKERETVEAEARSLPLPDVAGTVRVEWAD